MLRSSVTEALLTAGSVHALTAYQERLGEQRYFRRAIMQSGTFAVMGFWDRPRMNQIWASALVELGLDRSEDALGVLRSMPWQKLLGVKALDVSMGSASS